MSGGDPTSNAFSELLTVQVQGGGQEPERVLVLSRPSAGRVAVREFAVGCDGPRDFTATPNELRDLFERASRERRRLSEDLYTIRSWLEGR